MNKIKIIAGDLTEDGLGLNDVDRNLLVENVELVFNCAANVRFDMSLKDAINVNTAGVLRILQLATKMIHLKVRVLQFMKFTKFKLNINIVGICSYIYSILPVQ